MLRSFLLLLDGLLDLHQTFLASLFVFELYLHLNQSSLPLLDQQFLNMQIFCAVVEYPHSSCSRQNGRCDDRSFIGHPHYQVCFFTVLELLKTDRQILKCILGTLPKFSALIFEKNFRLGVSIVISC